VNTRGGGSSTKHFAGRSDNGTHDESSRFRERDGGERSVIPGSGWGGGAEETCAGNPKSEARNPKQIQISNQRKIQNFKAKVLESRTWCVEDLGSPDAEVLNFEITSDWNLFRISCFGFRD
jgi:hypothetical protein